MTVDGQPAKAFARGAYVFVVWKNPKAFMAWHLELAGSAAASSAAGAMQTTSTTQVALTASGFSVSKVSP